MVTKITVSTMTAPLAMGLRVYFAGPSDF
jgi:hypothetical protein